MRAREMLGARAISSTGFPEGMFCRERRLYDSGWDRSAILAATIGIRLSQIKTEISSCKGWTLSKTFVYIVEHGAHITYCTNSVGRAKRELCRQPARRGFTQISVFESLVKLEDGLPRSDHSPAVRTLVARRLSTQRRSRNLGTRRVN